MLDTIYNTSFYKILVVVAKIYFAIQIAAIVCATLSLACATLYAIPMLILTKLYLEFGALAFSTVCCVFLYAVYRFVRAKLCSA